MKKVYKAFLAATAIVVLFSLGGWQYSAQPYFEGEIVYKFGMDGSMVAGGEKDIPKNITLFYKGNKLKMTTSQGAKKNDVIYDFGEGIEYRIDHEKETVYKTVKKQDDESLGALFKNMEFTVEAKPDTLVIAGYKCKRYVITAEMDLMAMTIDMFTSDEINVKENAASNPLMDKMGLNMEEIKGFPLGIKYSFHFRGKAESMMMEAEKVNEKKLSYDLFKLPQGYQLVER